MATTSEHQQGQRGWTIETYVAHNEALRTQKDQSDILIQALRDRALELQAREYERRLEGLNHENARIATAAGQSVSRELFDAKIGPLESYVALAQGRGAGADSSRAMIAWVVAILASLIAIGSFVFRPQPQVAAAAPQIMLVPAAPGTMVQTPQPAAAPK